MTRSRLRSPAPGTRSGSTTRTRTVGERPGLAAGHDQGWQRPGPGLAAGPGVPERRSRAGTRARTGPRPTTPPPRATRATAAPAGLPSSGWPPPAPCSPACSVASPVDGSARATGSASAGSTARPRRCPRVGSGATQPPRRLHRQHRGHGHCPSVVTMRVAGRRRRRHRLGLRLRRAGPHRHEQPRRRGRGRRAAHHASCSPTASRSTATIVGRDSSYDLAVAQGRPHRPRSRSPWAPPPTSSSATRSSPSAPRSGSTRTVTAGHRQRPQPPGDARRRRRRPVLHQRHPDRRGDQPRQLRRAAARHGGPASSGSTPPSRGCPARLRRAERQHRGRLRHPQRPGAHDGRAADQTGKAEHPVIGVYPRPAVRRARACRIADEGPNGHRQPVNPGGPCRQGRARARRRDPRRSTAGRSPRPMSWSSRSGPRAVGDEVTMKIRRDGA